MIDLRKEAWPLLRDAVRVYLSGLDPLPQGQVWTLRFEPQTGISLVPRDWKGLAGEVDAGSLAVSRSTAAENSALTAVVIVSQCERADCTEHHANLMTFDAMGLRQDLLSLREIPS